MLRLHNPSSYTLFGKSPMKFKEKYCNKNSKYSNSNSVLLKNQGKSPIKLKEKYCSDIPFKLFDIQQILKEILSPGCSFNRDFIFCMETMHTKESLIECSTLN